MSWKIFALSQYGFTACGCSKWSASSFRHGFLTRAAGDTLLFPVLFEQWGLAAVWGEANPLSDTLSFLGTERNLFQPHSWSSKAGQTVLQMSPNINFFLLCGCLGNLVLLKHLEEEHPLSSEPQWFTASTFFPNMNYVVGSLGLGLPPTIRWYSLEYDFRCYLCLTQRQRLRWELKVCYTNFSLIKVVCSRKKPLCNSYKQLCAPGIIFVFLKYRSLH